MNINNRSQKKTLPSGISVGIGIAIVSFLSISASATTYFVDFSSGSDTNLGTSAQAPWQHCPGDTNAAGVALAHIFVAGDTVVFKGGVQYVGQIALNWSGSPTMPITYDGNSFGIFGTGRAVLNGQFATNQIYGLYTKYARTNLLLNSFEIEDIGGHSNITWTCDNLPPYVVDYGVYLANCSAVTISNCYIHDIGDWTNAPSMTLDIMCGYGISIESCSTVTITNCSFQHIGQAAIQLATQTGNYVATNIIINGCIISNYVTWGVAVSCVRNNSVIQGITIDGLTIHDDYQYAPGSWLGCAGKNPHCDGVFCFLGGNPAVTNCSLGTLEAPIVVRNSYFYNNADPGTNYGGTACITVSTWGGVIEIYNNVFVNVLNSGDGAVFIDEGTFWYSPGSSSPNYYIVNNTFYDTNRLMAYIAKMTNSNITVQNNFFYNAAPSGGGVPVMCDAPSLQNSTIVLDQNFYNTTPPGGSVAKMSLTSAGSYLTFAQLQTAGFEQHGVYGSPRLIRSGFLPGPNSSLNDLHLQSSCIAVAAGTNLSWMFLTDKDGRPRPVTGNWDIGAYQYGLSPPTNLRLAQ